MTHLASNTLKDKDLETTSDYELSEILRLAQNRYSLQD